MTRLPVPLALFVGFAAFSHEAAGERSKLLHHVPKPTRANRPNYQRTSDALNIDFASGIDNAQLARNTHGDRIS